MRLVCPNCASQYEVSDSAIPSSGRDVQCASCSHVWFQDAVLMLQPEEMLEVTPTPVAPEAPASAPDHDLQDLSQNISAEFRSMRGTPTTEAPEQVSDSPIETRESTPVNQSVKDILRSEAEFSTSRISQPEPENEIIADEPVVDEPPVPTTENSPFVSSPRLADILAEEASAEAEAPSTVSPLRRIQDAVAKAEIETSEPETSEPENAIVSPLRRIPSEPDEDEVAEETSSPFTKFEPEPKVEESQTGAELRMLRQRIVDLEKTADEPATPISEPANFESDPIEETVTPEPETSFTDVIQDLEVDPAEAILEPEVAETEEPIELISEAEETAEEEDEGPLASFAQAIEVEVDEDQSSPSEKEESDGILEAGEGLLSVAALRAERDARVQMTAEASSQEEPQLETTQKIATIESEPEDNRAEDEDISPLRPLSESMDEGRDKSEDSAGVRVRKFGEEPPLTSETTIGDEQLPDVDELNTSLRMDDKSPLQDIDITEEVPKKRGFYMRGILTAVLIFLLFALLFLLAKPLAQMFPVLAPVLEMFTGSVDQGLDAAASTAEKNSGAFGWISSQWDGMVSWLESF